jgi:BlaI family penicillinase repressor
VEEIIKNKNRKIKLLLTTATACSSIYIRQLVASKMGVHTMKNLGKLSETEMEVMQEIWKMKETVTVAQLMYVFKSKDWKTSTLSTILKRLINKGFLTKSMDGKVNLYYSTISLDEYRKYESVEFINRLYDGNIKSFIAAIVDDEGLSKNDIDELKIWFIDQVGE